MTVPVIPGDNRSMGMPAQVRAVRKCSDIPDAVFLKAIADTPAGDPRGRDLPAEGYGAEIRAWHIEQAVTACGWCQRTPDRRPKDVYATLQAAMGTEIPVKVFYKKAEKLDRRSLISAYERRWHLATECLDYGCCRGELGEPEGPLEAVTAEEIAFMERIQADRAERRARDPFPPMVPYDLDKPATLLVQVRPRAFGRTALLTSTGEGHDQSPRPAYGCRQHPESGTWIHTNPHTCPVYARSAAARRTGRRR